MLAPAIASAQSSSRYDNNRPGLVFFANGGGYSPVTDLNSSGSASLNTGWSLGGGAGIQGNRFVAVRGMFDYGRDKGDPGSRAFAGERLKHYFYGGDVQLRYPTPSGQGTSYIYKFDRGGFDKTQADLLWNGGLSYRVHL